MQRSFACSHVLAKMHTHTRHFHSAGGMPMSSCAQHRHTPLGSAPCHSDSDSGGMPMPCGEQGTDGSQIGMPDSGPLPVTLQGAVCSHKANLLRAYHVNPSPAVPPPGRTPPSSSVTPPTFFFPWPLRRLNRPTSCRKWGQGCPHPTLRPLPPASAGRESQTQ